MRQQASTNYWNKSFVVLSQFQFGYEFYSSDSSIESLDQAADP